MLCPLVGLVEDNDDSGSEARVSDLHVCLYVWICEPFATSEKHLSVSPHPKETRHAEFVAKWFGFSQKEKYINGGVSKQP